MNLSLKWPERIGTPAFFSALNQEHQKTASLVIATVLFYMCQKAINAQTFLGDAREYWFLSSHIWDMSFPQTIRGYFYPTILSPIKTITEILPALGYFPLRICQAFIYSITFTLILPSIFINTFGGKCSTLRRLITPIFLVTFFPGLISYPLSDLPAFALLLTAVYLSHASANAKRGIAAVTLMILSGVCAYGAYNVRSIYLFSVLILIFIIPTLVLQGRSIGSKIFLTSLFIAGLAISSMPQALINKRNFDSFTPLVISNIKGSSLFAAQLKWGIAIQRYETRINEDRTRAFPTFYFDPEASEILLHDKNSTKEATIKWYLTLVAARPISFLSIYAKHFVNGIDVRDYEIYTTKPSTERQLRSVISIAISYLGIFFLAMIFANRKNIAGEPSVSKSLWMALFLVPVAAILPGAIETRFFLPLHILIYAAIAFTIQIESIHILKGKYLWIVSAMYIALVTASVLSAESSISSPVGSIPEKFQEIIKR